MRVPLTGGAYEARSVIAGAQRCINLMPEPIPQDEQEPVSVVHYPTPGLSPLVTAPVHGAGRGAYRARTGTVFAVIGSKVFVITSTTSVRAIGDITSSTGPVSMSDNGVDLVIVDGSPSGWRADAFDGGNFRAIVDPAFYGANTVDVIDGFFVFDRPHTAQFYLSLNVSTAFDPLYIASKSNSDRTVAVCVTNRQVWVFGEMTSEIYQNAGTPDFPLQAIGGGIEHGCVAPYAVRKMDGGVFWLTKDRDGVGMVMRGQGYQATRVSTHAIEAIFLKYARIDDAIAWTYQQNGHSVYVISFPTANATWAYDMASRCWHEMQSSGGRHLGTFQVAAFGMNIVGSYTTSTLYALDPGAGTDDGKPIKRLRSFPHMIKNANRVFYKSLIADMQTGTVAAGLVEPQLTLRWSDDRGASWSMPITTGMGLSGSGITSLQFQRLGMARDRVFELSWDTPAFTALQGAWIQTKEAAS